MFHTTDLCPVLDLGDPISAPPGPYTLQPHVKGKFLWLTGSPGMGKSTTAQLLGRNKGSHIFRYRWTLRHSILGFVYYELDCFSQLRNPYIPLEVENPTMQQMVQRNLTGEGREERKLVCDKFDEAQDKIWLMHFLTGEDKENIQRGFEEICGDISRERARIGGDWVLAGAVYEKEHRDIVR